MTTLTVTEALENVYTSMIEDNADLDTHISALKKALSEAGEKQVIVEPERLAQNNRAGRKLMQSYFKKRGVTVVFKENA
ncbi:MAG: hypothetical protein AAGC58_08440 [Asticcacaulis sp.]